MAWRECDNCGGFMDDAADLCVRCGEDRNRPGGGQPRFSPEARNAPQEMGGLLALYQARGQVARFVGWCTGGAIALNDSGALVWAADLNYVSSLIVDGATLEIDGVLFDVDTGTRLNALRIVDAMTLRDGGTTCVTVEDGGILAHVTVDHRMGRLAWLPRFRFVFTSPKRFARDRRLVPWGKLERRYFSEIARAAIDELGHDDVRDYLAGLLPNPGHAHWFYVLNFLRIVHRSRLRSIPGSSYGL